MQRTVPRSDSDRRAVNGPQKAPSTLVNRNVTVRDRRTSMRLERAMWEALHEICRREGKSLNELVTEIDAQRSESSLTAAIRVYLLRYFSAAATDEGHRLAGHGERPAHHFPV
jgi:predicted DNA-binding ribbon-helix-helix protein